MSQENLDQDGNYIESLYIKNVLENKSRIMASESKETNF